MRQYPYASGYSRLHLLSRTAPIRPSGHPAKLAPASEAGHVIEIHPKLVFTLFRHRIPPPQTTQLDPLRPKQPPFISTHQNCLGIYPL